MVMMAGSIDSSAAAGFGSLNDSVTAPAGRMASTALDIGDPQIWGASKASVSLA